jgi:PAS domain S-box-containing protein
MSSPSVTPQPAQAGVGGAESTRFAPTLVLLVGLGMAAGAALWKQKDIESDAQALFEHSVEAVTEHVRSRLQLPVFGLMGAKGLYAASKSVERSEFRTYVESRGLASEFVGVRGFGFIQHVLRPGLDAFLKAQRSDGAPQFALRQLADKEHDDLYIVTFIEPAAQNVGVPGLDIGSEAIRRAAAQRAVDSGLPTITAAISLVQDQRHTPGLLLFVPVYANGAQLTTIAQRRAALVGLAYAPLVMADMLEGMAAVRAGVIDFELFDGAVTQPGAPPGTLLFDADQHTANAPVARRTLSTTRTLAFGGRDLTLRINSTDRFDAGIDRTTPWLVLSGGALLSALMALLLRQQATGRRRAEARALEMTADLRQAEASSHAYLEELQLQKYALDQHAIVATADVQGKITYVNDKFCEISGYTREELLGQDHIMLNSGTHPHGFFKSMYRTLATGKTWRDEVCNQAKSGQLYWVDTTIVPLMNSEGKPERYLAIRADITLRKQVELDLVQQQLNLEKRVQQKTKAAVQSENHLRLVINTSLDSIIGMDSKGRVSEWSRQAETTFGWTFAEVLGQYLHDFIIPERYREAHQKGLAHYLAAGVGPVLGKRIEIFALRRDGTEFPIELAISPIVTPQGTTFSAFISDVTNRKQEQAALMAAKALAESASRAKSEFLANMSHEIRTPMNGVIGMVDILQETALLPEQHRMLDTISQSSLALLQILNDILDFSKIEAGKLGLESVPMHLRDVAEGVAQLMGSLPGTEAEVALFVSTELPVWTYGDPSRLRQVLLNLLGNAIKFSNQQVCEVSLSVTPCRLADGEGVRFEVADNGIGMSPEVVAKLFKPFTQADESTARKFGGTGLGLSISQRLVELMGGRIAVRSTLGEGSEFTVELPLQAAPAQRDPPDLPSLAGVQVLIMTRNAFGIRARTAYCTDAGAQVHVLPDMASAREFLAQLPPDPRWVVLVDKTVSNPTRELGLSAAAGVVREAVRGTPTSPHDIVLPVRPMLHQDLIGAIARASGRLTNAHITGTGHSPERRVRQRPAAPTVEAAAQTRRLILLAEDNETNRDVMQEQLRLLGYTCEMANDGAIALKMWQASPARYALLLSDCHMPNLDGFGLTEAIRATEPAGTRLPIVAVTANAMQGEAQRCRERGMDDYLSKPLRMNELRDKLDQWMPEPVLAVPVLTEPAQVAAVGHTLPVWSPDTLTELVGDNAAMHKRLLERFLTNGTMQVAEITAAAVACDTAALAGIAHTLKSAARSVGALALGELCQHLETAGRAADAKSCSALAAGLDTAWTAVEAKICDHLGTKPT